MHYRLVLLSRAMQAWYLWLGMHLANATVKQERLLYLQVRRGCLCFQSASGIHKLW